jgi:hypothetical protein
LKRTSTRAISKRGIEEHGRVRGDILRSPADQSTALDKSGCHFAGTDEQQQKDSHKLEGTLPSLSAEPNHHECWPDKERLTNEVKADCRGNSIVAESEADLGKNPNPGCQAKSK